MADSDGLNQRDARLVQWLNEAHAKEAELEADLTAHIALTQKASYKKRLQQHLTETRTHKRQVAARIKKLGGSASTGVQLPGVPDVAGEVAGKAVAAVKGQVGAARAAITQQPETHLRNAQEELREEHVEIAIYSRIATFAEEVGDRETAQLAKSIRRDEERMAKFLDTELGRLVKELIRAEIPRDQRGGTTRSRRRRRTRRTTSSRSAASRSTSSRSTSSRSSTSRSAGSRSGSTARSRSTSSSRGTSSRRTSASRSSGRASSGRASSGRSSSGRSSSGRSSSGRGSSGRSSSGRRSS